MFLTSMFFEEDTKITVSSPEYESYHFRIGDYDSFTLYVRKKDINKFIHQLENTLNELKSIVFKED